jgi:hypothetical protein
MVGYLVPGSCSLSSSTVVHSDTLCRLLQTRDGAKKTRFQGCVRMAAG